MKPFYSNKENVAALLSEWKSWKGTRYSRLGEAKGRRGGVGCILYVVNLAEASKAIDKIDRSEIPSYVDDWSAHNRDSILDSWLLKSGYISQNTDGKIVGGEHTEVITDPSLLMIGDVLAFAPGRCTHHLATFLGNGSNGDEITQSLKPTGVETISMNSGVFINGRLRNPLDWFEYAIRIMQK